METIILPRIITREFIQAHPKWIFVYGNDWSNHGALGQAWFAHNEPNAYPVFTCRKLCPSSSNKYWQDSWPECWEIVQQSLDAIPYHGNGEIIIPFRKIGEGCSRMQDFAPKLFRHMKEFLDRIKYPNITIDYNL